MIQQTRRELTTLLSTLSKNKESYNFIVKIQSYIKEHLLPQSLDVSVLNQGEINALNFAGMRIWNYIHDSLQFNPSQINRSEALHFLSAILITQVDVSKRTLTIPPITLEKSESEFQYHEVTTTNEPEPTTPIRFIKIFKWIIIGFIILFILSFILLKLFK